MPRPESSTAALVRTVSLALALAAGCESPAPRRDPTTAPVSSLHTPREVAPSTASSPATRVASRPAAVAPTVNQADAELGQVAPNFRLPDLRGAAIELSQFRGKIVVLEWFDPSSPVTAHAWSAKGPLREQSSRAVAQGVIWLAIQSEGVGEGSSDSAQTRQFVTENKIKVPVLRDGDGNVARAYGARAARHMFVINEKGLLVYRGALDNAPLGKLDPRDSALNYVDEAVKDVRSGHAVVISEVTTHL